jgi:hypothetical protein
MGKRIGMAFGDGQRAPSGFRMDGYFSADFSLRIRWTVN